MDKNVQDHFKELNQELNDLKQEVQNILNKPEATTDYYVSIQKVAAVASTNNEDEQNLGKFMTDLNEHIDSMKQQAKTSSDTIKKLEVQKELKLQEKKTYINYYYYMTNWQDATRPVDGSENNDENKKKSLNEKRQDHLTAAVGNLTGGIGDSNSNSSSKERDIEGYEWLAWALKN